MTREGDALDGEDFLGIGGLVVGDEAGLDVGDGVEVFSTDDGETGKVEGFGFDGVIGGFADHVVRYWFSTGAREMPGRESVWD